MTQVLSTSLTTDTAGFQILTVQPETPQNSSHSTSKLTETLLKRFLDPHFLLSNSRYPDRL